MGFASPHDDLYAGEVRVVDTPEVRARYAQGYALPPVMSLFAPGKHTPVARKFVEAARQQWSN